MAEPALLRLAFRVARRELRGGLAGFRIFLLCLALGVAAIAAVGSISAALKAGLEADAGVLLGGDVEFRVSERALPADAVTWLRGQGTVSEVRLMRAMARRADNSARTLVELKAVDGVYPLYGSMALAPSQTLDQALAARDGVGGIVVDPLVLDRLQLKLGDRLALGEGTFEVRATIAKEPDAVASAFTLGPRVMIAESGLAAAGLDRPGTLSAAAYRLRVAPGRSTAALIKAAQAAFPDAGWQVRDVTQAAPGLEGFVNRTTLFLTLVGLTALLVGGVGVGNAASSYLAGKSAVIATLKCLGAPARLVHAAYLMQILVLASGGIAIGLVLGAVSPWLVQAVAGDVLPVALRLTVYPLPLALAAGFGVLTALGFSLLPLGRARIVPPASLFRGVIMPDGLRLGRADVLATGAVGLALAGLAIASAPDRRLAAWFVLAVAVAFASFRAAGWGVMATARRLGPIRRPWLRLAVANLHRPGAPTPSVVLSLGLGLTVLVAVTLVEGSLSQEVGGRLAEQAPSFFFIDIQPDQVADFDQLVGSQAGVSDLHRVPSLRARISRVNGIPAASAAVDRDQRWALESERGLTYAATLPAGSTLVEGAWWPADYHGAPLISLDQGVARGMHLKLGDTLSLTVAGREVTGQVANFRRIDWTSLGINFITVFSPGALEAAPQTAIATARVDSPADEEALSRAVTGRFPNVSAIRVRDALDTVARVLAAMAAAIRATAAVSILAGMLVLAGAIAAGHRRRVYDAVVLKVLGATRSMVARGFALEYGLLGLVTAVLAVGLGTLAAWLLVVEVMQADWHFAWGRVIATALGGTAVTLGVALAATWRALSARAAPLLRSD